MSPRNENHRPSASRGSGLPLGLITLGAGVAALALIGARHTRGEKKAISDAPPSALRKEFSKPFRERVVVGRTVTINRPRHALYAFWRDFSNLPRFMENVRDVTVTDERRSRWTIAAPTGAEIAFDATVTEDRPNELIAWRSDEDAAVPNSGRITFRDAPNGRGTEVAATIAYDPPGGEVGRLLAKVFQREPNIQARRDLKRFKQLMETGEIATAESARTAPRA